MEDTPRLAHQVPVVPMHLALPIDLRLPVQRLLALLLVLLTKIMMRALLMLSWVWLPTDHQLPKAKLTRIPLQFLPEVGTAIHDHQFLIVILSHLVGATCLRPLNPCL